MQILNTLQTQQPVWLLIAGTGDGVCCPGKGQDGTPVPCWGDGAVWPCGHSWLCPKSESCQVPSLQQVSPGRILGPVHPRRGLDAALGFWGWASY